MSKTICEMFLHVRGQPTACLTSNTLVALRDYFSGYIAAFTDNNIEPLEGDPPFRHFTDWVARRFNKSGKSVRGPWFRYHGGWWRLISDNFPNQEEAFRQFFLLFDEFRSRSPQLVKEILFDGNHKAQYGSATGYSLIALRAVKYLPDDGVYLIGTDDQNNSHEFGYFSEFDDIRNFAQSELGVDV